ncbi:MAG: amino acid adenylation domain-containing protein, partial [Anaerovoracaceae bacterium]
EFTDDATFFWVDKDADYRNIPIGRPLYNNTALIVDQHNQLLPQGAMGELCLSGPQMAKGYWKLPELTAQKFCTLSEQVPLKVYHTGDLARWNDQWQLEYMGRFDFQVKLRGYRIELGEIEVRAGQFEGVKQEVAVVKNEELCLYFTADRTIDTRALKEFMAETLAEFMVPSRFIQLDAMPLTPNGKINRSQLPEPEFDARDLVEPETELEKALFDIASGLLHRTGFGVTDSLIAAGLSSLGAMRFSVEVHHQLGRALRVSEIMHNPQIRSLAALLEEGENSGAAAEIPSYPQQLYYPLTENQKGIYLDWEMNRNTVQYNLPSVYRFTGVSAESLEEAVKTVINTHPSMKTRLAHWNGEVVQENRSSDPVIASVFRTEQEPDSAYFQSRVLPFDLFAQPLYRMEITESPQAVYLFMDCHHIIFDGLSRDIFLEDLADALEGILPEEEQLCAFDFALYEQELFESGAFVRAEAYFDDLMKDSAVAVYPSSRRLHTAEKGENGMVYAALSAEDGEEIRSFCSSQGITESSFWHSAFAEALSRITREEKPYYVTVSSGRAGTAGLSRTTGMFAKTLPVVLSCSGKDHAKTPVSAYTAAMHQQLQDTIDQDLYPYTRLVERHQLRAEIMFVYQGGVMEGGNSEALTEIPFMADQMKFPLEIMVYPTHKGYTAACGYDGTRYEASDIQMLANALCTCARTMLTAEAAGDICLADETEKVRLGALGAGDTLEYNQEETWLDLFRAQAMAMPERCAVADEDGFLTYGELARQSDCIAQGLIQRGVSPGSFVVLLTERRKEFLAAVLGIQKAGAAYVPVDPEYPQERKAYMVQDSCAALVLTDELIFTMLAEGTGAEEDPHLDRPEGRAYMIYTSGSTGKPKGVVQSHRALRAFVQWRRQLLDMGPDSRHAEHASFAFDASLDDLICPLAWGGEVHILGQKLRQDPDAMKQYFMDHQITGLTLPTQLGMAMLAQDPKLPLQFLMMGGEKLLPLKQHTDVRIINGYGPTEFTVCASYYEVDPETAEDIPIGRPVPGARVYICDGAGQLLPEGMTGELCLAGPQIAEGYWGQPQLTEEKFTVLAGTAPHRVYRTGDLARFNRDGNLEFCGRIDNQVKLRGYRIETEEIEHCALALAGVKQAAAAIRQDRICLYYTAESELPEDALRRSLARQLAGYMMPELYLRLEEMPLTSNGKVDYRQLPAIAQANPPSSVPPKNEREEIVCRCMGSILGMDRMPGADQDFFALGGDSIRAIRLVTLLRSSGVMVTVSDIMNGRTPAAIALLSREEGLQPAASQEPWTGMVPETPILQYFRELKLPVPAHFNLPVILRCRKRTDPAVLQSALDALTLQHDLLRAVIREDVLFVREPDVRIVLEEYSTEDVTGICEKIQKELAVSEALLRA